ncbi:hypothetical protein ACJW30_04G091700 [Castanea mollissima]
MEKEFQESHSDAAFNLKSWKIERSRLNSLELNCFFFFFFHTFRKLVYKFRRLLFPALTHLPNRALSNAEKRENAVQSSETEASFFFTQIKIQNSKILIFENFD